MGRSKKSPNELIQRARDNGFNDDMTGIDNKIIFKPIANYTKSLYGYIWNIWTEYQKTHPGASPHDIQTAKHFARLLSLSTQGKGGRERANHDTIHHYWRRFFSMWKRSTGTEIPGCVKETVKNYINGDLKDEIGLNNEHREHGFLTLRNYEILLKFLWLNDWHDYKHDGVRVRNTAAMHLYAYSSGRIGELVESTSRAGSGTGLHYRVSMLHSRQNQRLTTRVAISDRPQHPIYEGRTIPLVDPIIFLLAIALATEAFRDYSTLEEILAVRPAPDMEYAILEWKQDMLDRPFFQTMNSTGPTGKIVSATSFNSTLDGWSIRAGFERGIKIHDVRREALIKADDNNYSVDERMKFAGQRDPSVFRQSYMHAMSTVDGQGSFLGTELRRDHIEGWRSMSLRRQPQLWQSLPAKEQYSLEQRPDFAEIGDKIRSLTEEIRLTGAEETKRVLQARRQELYERRRYLTIAELNRLRQGGTAGTLHQCELEDFRRTFFARVRHVLPERDFLAEALFLPTVLRSSKGRQIVQNLVSLCQQNCQTVYHPNMRPKNGRCPIPSCSTEIDR
ncbi:hypothetical protein K432DRAFT_365291 [Lepidopterella palustris CBS 459.81]|uniref:Uncharacterized protein n=1 Tax=Lepidopterella palustris CBS 459.81 TaxID=1314670 RepID=A0A8E2DWZ9_9PEZI|nr:hypothetical protein K432DRAFT_365291 [Lepidopterella palustris CBS 459.81]